MHVSRSHHHHHTQSHPNLPLPSKREVSHFREWRLLTHLHEQLIEQIDENPNDWQLHFQVANLFAFTDDSFNKNKQIDLLHAETHYQKALKLLKTLHEQDYIVYQNANKIPFESMNNTPISSPFDIDNTPIAAIDEEEKSSQPKIPTLTISPLLYGNDDRLSYSSNMPKRSFKKQKKKKISSSKSVNLDTDYTYTTLQKRCTKKKKKRKRKKHNGFEISPPENKIINRKLLIAIHNHHNTIAKEIECNYASPMSEDEIRIQKEKLTKINKKQNSKKRKLKVDITAKYLSAVARLNEQKTRSKKRPSIIMMFNPNSPQNNGGTRKLEMNHMPSLNGTYSNNSPISLIQSESPAVITDIIDEYIIPNEINKGYTECFFGYGKYLCQNRRQFEGIHNLLECALWYNDSFVDPSCLTSLVLPPQFLFQDSVKKRHCINFRTLTKYISKLLTDQQRYLDKKFKKLNMNKYINEYNKYLCEFQKDIHSETGLIENHINNDSNGITPISTDCALFEYGISNTSTLSVDTYDLQLQLTQISSLHSNQSLHSNPSILSPGPLLLSPGVSNTSSNMSYDNINNNKQLINYCVYPSNIQDLVNEYIYLCEFYHRLGLLLSDFLRYSDAKRQYNKAIQIFKKLKIKPQLYDDILSQIRNTQRTSIQSATSCQERAQMLAQKHKSHNVRAPVSPSFEFSFSEQFKQHNDITPFLIASK